MNDNKLVNFLRLTSALQISRAKSGHPGIALGGAPIVYSIYKNAFITPNSPNFLNRDRIVFSAGHASALIYSTLHLFGYNVTVDDLKNFRKINSITPGHPEVNLTDGVDASTGPLGQGIAMSVGFAIAEEFLHNKYKRGKFSPIDHFTYCFCGDGCLMEGVAQEALSLAGNLKLGKLILLYDKNDTTIEGNLHITNSEDVEQKFLAMNWNVLSVADGNNVKDINKAIQKAKRTKSGPTVIIVNTTIGFGTKNAGTNIAHSDKIDDEQLKLLRKNLNYDIEDWTLSTEQQKDIEQIKLEKQKLYDEYFSQLAEYKKTYKKEYSELFEAQHTFEKLDLNSQTFLNEVKKHLPQSYVEKSKEKTDFRVYGHAVLNAVGKYCPNIIGGCGDLAPSTRANFDNIPYFSKNNKTSKNIAFGIREHAMASICNGISLHGGLKSFCSTFLAFSNYMMPAIRLSALMNNSVLYYFTHDTLMVGEDGPTHQPVEQLPSLRSMPSLFVFRPSCEQELRVSFGFYLKSPNPIALVLPRQSVNKVDGDFVKALRGGYIVSDNKQKDFDLTIIASGSEVALAQNVAKILANNNVKARVVSILCEELFCRQSKTYQNSVVDKNKPVFCLEMSSDNVWYKYATSNENVFNLNTFGVSGEANAVAKKFGFDETSIAKRILKSVNKQ